MEKDGFATKNIYVQSHGTVKEEVCLAKSSVVGVWG